jgi:hypothetical protein
MCAFILSIVIRHSYRIFFGATVICGLSVCLYRIFTHCLQNGTIFGKEVIGHKMYALTFSANLSGTFFILRIIQGDIIINMNRSSCEVPVMLVVF